MPIILSFQLVNNNKLFIRFSDGSNGYVNLNDISINNKDSYNLTLINGYLRFPNGDIIDSYNLYYLINNDKD